MQNTEIRNVCFWETCNETRIFDTKILRDKAADFTFLIFVNLKYCLGVARFTRRYF